MPQLKGRLITSCLIGLALMAPGAPASAKSTVVRECGRMTTPSGSKAWAYSSKAYDCTRARKILHTWLFDGAKADLRGWRCFSGTQAGQIVTCRRGANRVHMQRTGRKGATVRVD